MDSRAGRWALVRKVVWFADSPSSSAPVPRDREEEAHPGHGLHITVRVPISAVDRIPPARLAPDTRHAREWVELQVCRLRECPPNRLAVRERQGAVRDSAISTGLKKAP